MPKFFLSTSSFDNLIVTLQPRPGDKELTLQRALDLYFVYGRPEFTEEAAAAARFLSGMRIIESVTAASNPA